MNELILYLNNLERLRGKIHDYRIELRKYFSETDIRVDIFNKIDRILIYHDTNLVRFVKYGSNPNFIYELFKTDSEGCLNIQSDYITRNRHSLVIFIQSVIEDFYRTVYNPIMQKTPPQSCSVIIKNVFSDIINIPIESDWYKANNLLLKIRNTLHNNGTYNHKQETIIYKGINHIFSPRKPHNSADYRTLINIIDDILNMLYDLAIKTRSIAVIKEKEQ